jgi:hypothetical protein
MRNFFSIALLLFLSTALFSQVDKIKIKNEESKTFSFKNDTCNFTVTIAKSVLGKNLILHSLSIKGSDERAVMQTIEFRRFLKYIETKIDMKAITIQAMCLDICKFSKYKLNHAEVGEHIYASEKYKNRAAITLTFETLK